VLPVELMDLRLCALCFSIGALLPEAGKDVSALLRLSRALLFTYLQHLLQLVTAREDHSD